MITKISGILEAVTETSIILDREGMSFEVLAPRYFIDELRDRLPRGESIRLHTKLIIEAGIAMSSMRPVLIGFPNAREREFFSHFTSVKGLGDKKALKAMILPAAAIAGAIEHGDTATLLCLPGIGKRLADQIIAQLKGKLADFADGKSVTTPGPAALTPVGEEALEILMGTLGYRDKDAQEMVGRALSAHPGIDDTQQLMQAIFEH